MKKATFAAILITTTISAFGMHRSETSFNLLCRTGIASPNHPSPVSQLGSPAPSPVPMRPHTPLIDAIETQNVDDVLKHLHEINRERDLYGVGPTGIATKAVGELGTEDKVILGDLIRAQMGEIPKNRTVARETIKGGYYLRSNRETRLAKARKILEFIDTAQKCNGRYTICYGAVLTDIIDINMEE